MGKIVEALIVEEVELIAKPFGTAMVTDMQVNDYELCGIYFGNAPAIPK